LARDIELGREAPFSEDALIRIRQSNRSTTLAMGLLCRLETLRKSIFWFRSNSEWEVMAVRLKAFSADTWPSWFETAWKALLANHGGWPERDPELRRLGL
jgi:hypothetical protein